MIRLGINLDHIATLRQAREERYPCPTQAALLAELGGADNITCHLREDRRHIQDKDIWKLKEAIQIPLNFEIAATEEMLDIACRLKPHAVTLVPEKRQELTTEGGLDMQAEQKSLGESIKKLKDHGILVSMFVEPDQTAIELCRELNADAIEIHTGQFCIDMNQARRSQDAYDLLAPFQKAATIGKAIGLQVHFGHGLHYNNAQWLQLVPEAEEANIGHAVVARALYVGLKDAVSEMKDLLNNPQWKPDWI